MADQSSAPPLTEYVPVEEYVKTRPQFFASLASWAWFERDNRAAVRADAALICPTGRKLVHPSTMDRKVLEIGARKANRTRAIDTSRAAHA